MLLAIIGLHIYFFVCKGLSNDGVGVSQMDIVFQKIRPGAGFKAGDFAKERLGGYRGTTCSRVARFECLRSHSSGVRC